MYMAGKEYAWSVSGQGDRGGADQGLGLGTGGSSRGEPKVPSATPSWMFPAPLPLPQSGGGWNKGSLGCQRPYQVKEVAFRYAVAPHPRWCIESGMDRSNTEELEVQDVTTISGRILTPTEPPRQGQLGLASPEEEEEERAGGAAGAKRPWLVS